MNLIWLNNAITDLDEIVTLNPRAVATLYNKIFDKTDVLRTHPRIAPRELLLLLKRQIN